MEDPVLPYQLFAGPIISRGCALQECKPYSTVILKVRVVVLCQTPLEPVRAFELLCCCCLFCHIIFS